MLEMGHADTCATTSGNLISKQNNLGGGMAQR